MAAPAAHVEHALAGAEAGGVERRSAEGRELGVEAIGVEGLARQRRAAPRRAVQGEVDARVGEAPAHHQVHRAEHAVGAHRGGVHRVALDVEAERFEQFARRLEVGNEM